MVMLMSDVELDALRALAESAMGDIGTIRRPTRNGEIVDGVWTPSESVVVWSGPMRLRPAGAQESERIVGDSEKVVSAYTASIPHTAIGVESGDVVTVTASDDPLLVNRVFRVVDVAASSLVTYRRLTLDTT